MNNSNSVNTEEVADVEIITCKYCGQQLYEDDTRWAPTERRGWTLFIPHFCCCGRCSWECTHDHLPLDIVCSAVDINHSPSIIRKEC